jgi:hypothetical protein
MTLAISWRRLAITAFTLASLAMVLYTLGAPVHGG